MVEDTTPTPPEAVPGQDARLIGVVRAQLRRYRALTGATGAGQAGVYLTGRDLARLADLADEALTLRTFRDAIDAASVAYHSGGGVGRPGGHALRPGGAGSAGRCAKRAGRRPRGPGRGTGQGGVTMAFWDINIDLALTVEADSLGEALEKIERACEKLPLCHEDIYHPIVNDPLFAEEREETASASGQAG